MRGDYWHIRGLEIENAGDNCINISGSHNTVEDVVMHDCGDTGLQITACSRSAGDQQRARREQPDPELRLVREPRRRRPAARTPTGSPPSCASAPGNVFRGCRAWNNADDGWDLFAAERRGGDRQLLGVLERQDGQRPATTRTATATASSSAASPTAPDQGGAVHLVTNSSAFENRTCGFVRNNNPSTPTLSGCRVKSNPRGDYCSLSCSGAVTITATTAGAKVLPRDPTTKNLPTIN